MKEECDADLERHPKEVDELKDNEALAKDSAVEEFKSSDDFQEAMEKEASTYFGEGFNLFKN